MPVAAVKYEDLWERAKARVKEQYPEIKVGSDRYWSLVMSLYKSMEARREK
jgi:hypothetical protein